MEKAKIVKPINESYTEEERRFLEEEYIQQQEKSKKALIDLIDQRIDERMKEFAKAKQAENQKYVDEWIEYYSES